MNLEKKDWESLKQQAELRLKQALIDICQFENLLKVCEDKIKEFPTEEQEALKELKEILE